MIVLSCQSASLSSLFVIIIKNKSLLDWFDTMAEAAAFAEMLQDKNHSDKFDLHRMDRDSNGVEKAIKVDKNDVAQKTKMSAMAQEVIESIMD